MDKNERDVRRYLRRVPIVGRLVDDLTERDPARNRPDANNAFRASWEGLSTGPRAETVRDCRRASEMNKPGGPGFVDEVLFRLTIVH